MDEESVERFAIRCLQWQQEDPSRRIVEVKVDCNESPKTWIYDKNHMVGCFVYINQPIPDVSILEEMKELRELERLEKKYRKGE